MTWLSDKLKILRLLILLAGVLGVEPRIKVLETFVMPFHYTPIRGQSNLLRLFMQRVLFVPLAILFEFDFGFDHLLIALGVVIDMLAHRALKFDEIVLRHRVG